MDPYPVPAERKNICSPLFREDAVQKKEVAVVVCSTGLARLTVQRVVGGEKPSNASSQS